VDAPAINHGGRIVNSGEPCRYCANQCEASAGLLRRSARGGACRVHVLRPSLAAIVYYAITYAITALALSRLSWPWRPGQKRQAQDLPDSVAVHLLSACLLVFMLSLAGIPPLSGAGKFCIFASSVNTDMAPCPRYGWSASASHECGFALLLS
jgi:hypothetical protein